MNQPSKSALIIMILLTLILLAGLASSCDSQAPVPAATASATLEPTAAGETAPAPAEGESEVVPEKVNELSTSVAERTPVPTPTPSHMDRRIAEVAAELGVSGKTFLGITTEDWIDLVFSILIVLVGYFLGVRLVKGFLRWFAKRTDTELDNALIQHMEPDLEWLAVLFFTRFAILRLDFISDQFRTVIHDIFFGLGLILFIIICIRLIRYGAAWYLETQAGDKDIARLTPIVTSFERIAILILLVIMLSIGLAHFGINIGLLTISILVIAAILSFGAKDIIADAISGFVILIDQPFRIQDGIQIEDSSTWGDVIEIGNRTTRILTRDNREVIIPNTRILNSQIINYTYPDPAFRMRVDLHIAYDTDLEQAKRVVYEAVGKVDSVLPDKEVEVLLVEFGPTARKLRVRWWVADYHQPLVKVNQVCMAIDAALDQAGIAIPITTYDLNVQMQSGKNVGGNQLSEDQIEMES